MNLGFWDDHRKLQKHHMVEGWLGDLDIDNKKAGLKKAHNNESKKMSMKHGARYNRDRKEYQAKNLRVATETSGPESHILAEY
jgi:hypothetical protein